MFFRPILNPSGPDKLTEDLSRLADKLGVPVKNVRQWWYNDSIPGIWYERVAATGAATLSEIAGAGTAQGMSKAKPADDRREGAAA